MTRPEMTAPTPPSTPTIADESPATWSPRRKPSSRERHAIKSKMTDASRSTIGKCVLPPCSRCQKKASITGVRSAEFGIDDREAMPALDVIDFGNAEHRGQEGWFDFHRTRLR